mmetsp:Transcript_16283/g.47618  ORF Transcript_16283/g.47618 Transcript_16283/m.47618 type:complete len:277 (-) Transcript_16283:1569-2399(-)
MPGKSDVNLSSSKHFTPFALICTSFSSILSCFWRTRRAVRNWFSSGRFRAPGRRSKADLLPAGVVCSVCTRCSPFLGSFSIRRTTSTSRMASPALVVRRLASPCISSAENSFRLLLTPWPKLERSTPQASSCSANLSSCRPIGASTRPETSSEPSAPSLIRASTAWRSVHHSRYLTLCRGSSAVQGAHAGRPQAAAWACTQPRTTSFRYTVLTPGKDGDSNSSSKTSLTPRWSRCTAQLPMPSSSSSARRAASGAFSWGRFLLAGSRQSSRLRPSG